MSSLVSPIRDIVFEPFGKEHLAAAVALSTAAGWAHRREDWEMLLPFSRGVAASQNGKIMGTALRADFGRELSTVNMIIVAEAMRSKGLGRALIEAAIGVEVRSLRLVATESGQPLYKKLGFETVAKIACVQGIVKPVCEVYGVADALEHDLDEISALESASFGGDRTDLINWFEKHARMSVIRDGNSVAGFAACRRFGHGHVIGPVVASNAEDGLSLIAYLAKDLEGELLRIDVTENSGLQQGLSALGLEVRYLAPIMQRGRVSATPERLAFASQALA
ncbi:MAG: GNAT family N-acetyltransferase [Pseudomonadota bacterium]